MHHPVSLFSLLLAALHVTAATIPHQNLPRRPISFSPLSQHPILTHESAASEPSLTRGTINIYSFGLHSPTVVTYSLSPRVCEPLVRELHYIIADLTRQLLAQHSDGIAFPSSSEKKQTSPLPVYVAANITEQIYRSKFVLGVSLKLSPIRSNMEKIESPSWQTIMGLLEQSVLEMDRDARKSNGMGLGNAMVLEMDLEEVHVLSEWRFWRVVDGLALLCDGK